MLSDDIAGRTAVDDALDRWRLRHLYVPDGADIRIPSPWSAEIIACHRALDAAVSGDAAAREAALAVLGEDERRTWCEERVEALSIELLALGRRLVVLRSSHGKLTGITKADRNAELVACAERWVALFGGLTPADVRALRLGTTSAPRDVVARLERGSPDDQR